MATPPSPESSSNGAADASVSIEALSPADAELAADRQKEIWDAEHATHLIEHRFGVQFRGALGSRDDSGLSELVHSEAEVSLRDWRRGRTIQISAVSSARTNEANPTSLSDREGLVRWLTALHHDHLPSAKYSLRVLAIESGARSNTWKARVLLTAQSKFGSGQIRRTQSTHHVTFQWDDVNELEQSASVRKWEVQEVKQDSSPQAMMREATEAAGLDRLPINDNWRLPRGRKPQMICFQMSVADFDLDGFLDIAIASAGNNFLLRSVNGRFQVVTTHMGIHTDSRGEHVDISATWFDYDNDGFPDLILGGRLYHNDEGTSFSDVTDTCGIEFHPHHMGCAVADYDLDGHLDVYFLYAHDAKSSGGGNKAWIGDEQSGGQNQLWRNQGDGTFVDVTAEAGVEGGKRQTFAATWLHANDDHFPDLYVANDFGTNSLLQNRGDGTFEDISTASATADFATSMGVASGDLNNDGNPEIYVANMYSKMGRRIVGQVKAADYPQGIYSRLQGACAGSRLYTIGTDDAPRYREISELAGVNQVGWAYAPTMADFNNDGLLDIYATCGFLSVDRSKPDG